MRICIICSGFSDIYGGVETVVFKLGELWAENGHEVCIISGRGNKAGPKGVKLIKLPFLPRKYFPKIPLLTKIFPDYELEGLSLLPAALLCLIRVDPDIVLSNQLGETLPALIFRVPSIMISQAPIMLRFNEFKGADSVIVNDPASEKALKESGFKNTSLILNGTEIAPSISPSELTLSLSKIPIDGPVFLTAARLVPQKRIHLLIEAFKLIEQPATLVIAGDGPELSKLRSMVPEFLKSRVIFLGGVSHDQLPRLYQKCNVFTLPDELGFRGWFGLVQIEAIGSGRHVVTTPSELRKSWLSPFAIFPNVENPKEYAEALVATASKRIDTKSDEFRNFIYKFDWKHIAQQYIEAFNSVLRKRAN